MAINVLVRGDSIPGFWYDDLDALLSGSYTVQVRSNGGGTIVSWLPGDFAVVAGYWDAGASQNIAVFSAGTNDFYFNESVANTTWRLRDWCEARKLEGWKVIVCTMLPRDDFSGGSSTLPGANAAAQSAEHEVRRLAFNTFVRDHWQEFADGIVDMGANSLMGDKGDELNATYYFDKVHPASAGEALLASLVEPVIYTTEAASGNGWLSYRRTATDIIDDAYVNITGDSNDDGTGDVIDTGSAGANGTWTGTPGYATGPYTKGKALVFAGDAANYVTLPALPSLAGDFAIECWIQPEDKASNDYHLWFYNVSSSTGVLIVCPWAAENNIQINIGGNGGAGERVVGAWFPAYRHLVVRFIGGESQVWINGAYVTSVHLGGVSAVVAASVANFSIARYPGNSNLSAKGKLYGLKMLLGNVGPADIKTLYEYDPDAPTNTTPPSIAGTPTEGQTLTFTPGDWSNADSVATQWFENTSASTSGGTPISAFSVYRLRHVGKYYYVREIGTNVSGTTEVFSAVVGPVAALATQVRFPCQAETSGTQLNDTSGNGRHCTLTGTAGIAAMREQTGPPNFPQMIRVNASGLDDVLGFSYTLGGVTPYTIGMWVRLSLAITGATINRFFATSPDTIGMTHDHTGGAYQDAIYRGSAGFPVAGLPGRPLPLGSLIHVASVFDGTQMIPYVNGVAGTPTATAVSITNATTWSILFENRAAFCDFRIYNQALNATQIADWVASGGGGRRPRRMGFGFGIGF